MASSMAEDKNKQEEQPQATQTTPEQPQEIVSPYSMHMQELGSIGAEMEALQAKYDARQATLNDMQKRINDAKANQMSVLSAFVQQQKPVYDEKKEKRMRNRAMIQAFGDVLAEASKGYFAYNKKGAGVVPKSTPSNALEEVNKISEMQKKYLDEKKAWDTLNMDWQAKKTQADIDAAEALLTKEEKYQDEIEDRIEKLRERGVNITDSMRDAIAEQVMKEYNAAREMEDKMNYELWLRENKLGQYAPSKARSGGGGSTATTAAKQAAAEENELVAIYERLHGFGDGYGWKDLLASEQKVYKEKAKNDIPTAACKIMMDNGLSFDEAVGILNDVKNSGQSIEQLYVEWATSRTGYTLADYLAANAMNGLKNTIGML